MEARDPKPLHVARDLCDTNADAGWIPTGQPYHSGHHPPLFHPEGQCIQEITEPVAHSP